MDLRAWLQSLGLERYEGAFRENAIAPDVLPELTDQDLEKIGVLLGDRRRLLRAITQLDVADLSTSAPTATVSPAQSAPVVPPFAGTPAKSASAVGTSAAAPPKSAPPATAASAVSPTKSAPAAATSAVSPARSAPAVTSAKSAPLTATAALPIPAVVEVTDERLNVVKLRPNQSALPADVPKEVFALEDAIRQVTNESKDKSRKEPGAGPKPETAPPRPARPNRPIPPQIDVLATTLPDALLSARARLLKGRSARSKQPETTAREVVDEENVPGNAPAKAPETSLPPRDAFEPADPEYPPADLKGQSSRKGQPETNFGDAADGADDLDDAPAKAPQTSRAPRGSFEPRPPQYPSVDAKGRSSRKRQEINLRDTFDEAHGIDAATPKAPRTSRPSRDPFAPIVRRDLSVEETPDPELEEDLDQEDLDTVDYDAGQQPGFELTYEPEDEPPLVAAPRARRMQPLIAPEKPRVAPAKPRAMPEKKQERKRPPLSSGGLARLLVVLLILGGIVAAVSWQWSTISDIYQFLGRLGENQTRVTAKSESSPRVAQEQTGGQAPATAAEGSQIAAPSASLIEADASDPQGKRFVGSVTWRTETMPGGPGAAPEIGIRGDIEIPERRMTVTWSMRRNTDKSLPASHTIEITFSLPADFAAGGIASVSAIVMKQSEDARGSKLAARIAKVTNGFFLIGLSAADTDVQRDKELLKDLPWFDIGIIYSNGNQAILALQKGESGNRAFEQALAAWDKK
jgi:SAM domain (Sterile alpha motif)